MRFIIILERPRFPNEGIFAFCQAYDVLLETVILNDVSINNSFS